MQRIVLKILLLVVVFVSSIRLINIVFIPKRPNGIIPVKSLYEQEEGTIDALFLGSSHCGIGIDIGELWKSYGISGFALWGSTQPPWNSYYYLREALKTQSPEVVAYGEGHFILIKGKILQEELSILNIYAPNTRTPHSLKKL